ncbi:type VII secretion system-associated protein [Streptomyces sp. Edi2]|uniref:type VII secretion system-associated protein n=1 Tax=Streptomyces sp. Edi2 TaxID=3162528 RepID=UPI003305FAF1
MADENKGGGPLVLNKEWIKKFIDVDLHEFRGAIEKILVDAPAERFAGGRNDIMVQSITNLMDIPKNVHYSQKRPLTLGKMGQDGIAGDLVKSIAGSAKKLGDFVGDQKKLFDHIESNLRDAMETLLKTEGESLDKIDGEKFYNVFEDVADDISESMGSGGGNGGGGGGGGGGGKN